MHEVGIVGSGPTAIYVLQGLLLSPDPLRITIYEKTGTAGTGMPYRFDTNHDLLLANIASIELPAVLETLEKWLRARSDRGLEELGLNRHDVTERGFFPRVAIGSYYRDQLFRMVEKASATGHEVKVLIRHEVKDVVVRGKRLLLEGKTDDGSRFEGEFDRLVLATGHTIDNAEDAGPTFFSSPYPSSRLKDLPAGVVGILGTSLSAIDASITIALERGDFVEEAGIMTYRLKDEQTPLQIALMSRSGILPEADFFCPIPYQPLAIFTPDAIDSLIESGSAGLLDRVMDLFVEELTSLDPDYARSVNLAVLTADTFPEAYFRPRTASDPFSWARLNLAEVAENQRLQRTIAWRYGILRMHEVMEDVVAHLDDDDRKRFDKGLKKLFVDNYAAIPPESVKRLLALNDASALVIHKLGDGYERKSTPTTHSIVTSEATHDFAVLIDATGEGPVGDADMPFPGLSTRFASVARARRAKRSSNMEVDDLVTFAGIYVGSLPYLLGERPFIQGLVSCHEVGSEIASALIAELIPANPGSSAPRGDGHKPADAFALQSLVGEALPIPAHAC